jgi:vacuolar-type H+-ATPase subunit I/STV1
VEKSKVKFLIVFGFLQLVFCICFLFLDDLYKNSEDILAVVMRLTFENKVVFMYTEYK